MCEFMLLTKNSVVNCSIWSYLITHTENVLNKKNLTLVHSSSPDGQERMRINGQSRYSQLSQNSRDLSASSNLIGCVADTVGVMAWYCVPWLAVYERKPRPPWPQQPDITPSHWVQCCHSSRILRKGLTIAKMKHYEVSGLWNSKPSMKCFNGPRFM